MSNIPRCFDGRAPAPLGPASLFFAALLLFAPAVVARADDDVRGPDGSTVRASDYPSEIPRQPLVLPSGVWNVFGSLTVFVGDAGRGLSGGAAVGLGNRFDLTLSGSTGAVRTAHAALMYLATANLAPELSITGTFFPPRTNVELWPGLAVSAGLATKFLLPLPHAASIRAGDTLVTFRAQHARVGIFEGTSMQWRAQLPASLVFELDESTALTAFGALRYDGRWSESTAAGNQPGVTGNFGGSLSVMTRRFVLALGVARDTPIGSSRPLPFSYAFVDVELVFRG